MRAIKAKKLRKQVYGDYSLREEREYKKLSTGQIVATGRRRIYQKSKNK
jgi:hypothetical protein